MDLSTGYVVVNEDGKALDKDGYDPRKPEELVASQFSKYIFEQKSDAESFRNWQDPEGKSGLTLQKVEWKFEVCTA